MSHQITKEDIIGIGNLPIASQVGKISKNFFIQVRINPKGIMESFYFITSGLQSKEVRYTGKNMSTAIKIYNSI